MNSGRPLTVALDATPLLGTRTGIGRYVQALTGELATDPELRLRLAAFSLRGRAGLADRPAGTAVVHRPVPARLLHRAWLRGDRPGTRLVVGRADVVHGTNFVLPPGARRSVVTVHDLSFWHSPELVAGASLDYRTLVPRSVRRADVVLTPTAAVADEVRAEFDAGSTPVVVTPLGVDAAWFEPPDAPPPGFPAHYLLALGSLEPRKNLATLVTAYARLVADRPDVPPLVLAGPAGWGGALPDHGLGPGQLIRAGYLDSATVRSAVGHAAALAFPSRYEGFGLPVLEAMAAGVPVLASDIAAVREVAGTAPSVRRLPPLDADAWAQGLQDMADRPPASAELGAGRERARGFTWARTAHLTAAAYRG